MLVKGKNNVTLHQADGLIKSLEIYKKENPKGNVLFFVDGDHSYESVKKELKTILENIPQAIVILHDTFYQSSESGYNIGPFVAVNEVVNTDKYSIISTQMGLPGMSLVYKKSL